MKLARIDHIRCDEPDGATLVWIEDSMTEDDLQEAVERAGKAYVKAVSEFMNTKPPEGIQSAYSQPNWERNRDRKVGEVLDEHAKLKEQRTEWDRKRREAIRPFDEFLHQEPGIEPFWEGEFVNGDMYWGHRHGESIQYGTTEWPRFKLLKTVKRQKPGGRVIHVSDDEEWA